MELTKAAQETFDFFLARIPERLAKYPDSSHTHAGIASAYRYLDDPRWKEHCQRAIELCSQELELCRSDPGVTLDMVYSFIWADDLARATTHLDSFIAHNERTKRLRSHRPVDWTYYEALILRQGQLDKLVRAAKQHHDDAERMSDQLTYVVKIIEADRASDRRGRDGFAKELLKLPGSPEQPAWYRSLSSQMKTAGGLRRSTALPAHPATKAKQEYTRLRHQLGTDAVATQRRAAQAGLAVDPGVIHRYALDREALASRPKPCAYNALYLGWSHRMAGNEPAARAAFEDVVTFDDLKHHDLATALFYLGDDRLLDLVDDHRADSSDYLVRYVDIVRGKDIENNLKDLERWAKKTEPSEISLPLVRDVLDEARRRI